MVGCAQMCAAPAHYAVKTAGSQEPDRGRMRRVIRYADAVVIIVMRAAGAGKTSIAQALAAELGWTFVDADDLRPGLHPVRFVVLDAMPALEKPPVGEALHVDAAQPPERILAAIQNEFGI